MLVFDDLEMRLNNQLCLLQAPPLLDTINLLQSQSVIVGRDIPATALQAGKAFSEGVKPSWPAKTP